MESLFSFTPESWLSDIPVWFPFLILTLALWSIMWKGLGLWNTAKKGDIWWFIAILLINSLGILEIIYLFVVRKKTLAEVFSFLHHS